MIKEAQYNILLLTKDKSTVETLNTVLGKNHGAAMSCLCQQFSELTSHLRDTACQAVIIDIDPDPLRILNKIGTITTMYPEIRVIVVSNSFSSELILHAMQVGARNYLRKNCIEAELEKILEQIISGGLKSDTKSGSIISVLPVSGGCGATTVSVNLSNEIRIASSDEVLIVDLDSYYTTVALYLGISTEYGISDIFSHTDDIDKNLLKSSSYNYLPDFHVLTNTSVINSSELNMPKYDNLNSLLELCKKTYKYTIIDTPCRMEKDVLEKLVDISEVVVVVFQPGVKDLKLAQSFLSFIQSSAASEKIILLVNQLDKRESLIKLKDCQEALGSDSLYSIRRDYQKVAESFNMSQPIAQLAPKSKIRRDFQDLASNIINIGKLSQRNDIFG